MHHFQNLDDYVLLSVSRQSLARFIEDFGEDKYVTPNKDFLGILKVFFSLFRLSREETETTARTDLVPCYSAKGERRKKKERIRKGEEQNLTDATIMTPGTADTRAITVAKKIRYT